MIWIREEFLGFTTSYNHLSHGFEPIPAILFSIFDFLTDFYLMGNQLVLLRKVFLGADCTLQAKVKEIIKLLLDLLLFILKMLNRCPMTGLPLGFLLVEFPQHVLRPLIGQRDLFDDPAHLLKHALLAQVLPLVAGTALVCASVVMVPFLHFSADRAPATSAVQEADERKLVLASSMRLALASQDFLHIVEQSLAHNWLERAREQLAIHLDDPRVDGTLQHPLQVGHWQNIAFPRAKTEASKFVSQ